MGTPKTIPKDASEEMLLNQARKGNEYAFQILFQKHQPGIFALVSSMSRSNLNIPYYEIEDVVQETMIKAWNGLPKFRGDAKFSTWLYSIARNHARNVSLKNKKFNNTLHASDMKDYSFENLIKDETDPLTLLEQQEYRSFIYQEVEKLPPKLKNVYLLRERDDLSYLEISKVTDTRLGTVKTQIYRARQILIKKMRNCYFKENNN